MTFRGRGDLLCAVAVAVYIMAGCWQAQAAEYIAFSLQQAEKQVAAAGSSPASRDEQLFTLAGINRVVGCIYDRQSGDVILVGQHVDGRPPLTLDDFAVAVRSQVVAGKWPLVSIYPMPDTPSTQMQVVRFEGGVVGTGFGRALFDADLWVKKLSLGLVESPVPGLPTNWDLHIERLRKGQGPSKYKISEQVWLYPADPIVDVCADVVAVHDLGVKVFTTVLAAEVDGKPVENLSAFADPLADRFAEAVSGHIEDLATSNAAVGRLVGLCGLVGVVTGLGELQPGPALSFWARRYPVAEVATPTNQQLLRNRYEQGTESYEAEGGVHLPALAFRLKTGDASALKRAALQTRPSPSALFWSFAATQWAIPSSAELEPSQIGALFTRAVFLQWQKRYDEAIALYSQILGTKPDCAEVYNCRGNAHADKGDYEQAIADYTKALELRPDYAEAYSNRGGAYDDKGDYDRAIADCNKALELNPDYANAYNNRALAYMRKGEYERAIADCTKALELRPDFAVAYCNRGAAYADNGDYVRAIADFTKALELRPDYAEAYSNRGAAYIDKGEYGQAIADLTKALELKPDFAVGYCNRGAAYAGQGNYDRAIADLTKALDLKPDYAEAYSNRGATYADKGDHERALADFAKALDLKPDLAQAYSNRALVYATTGSYEEAIADYTIALELRPDDAATYANRGAAYAAKGDYDQAIADYTKALDLRPGPAEVYNSRGLAYGVKGDYEQALADFSKALELRPDYAEAYFNKAVACQFAMGKYPTRREEYRRQAIEALQKFIELAPGQKLDQHIPQARQMLRQLGAY